MKDGGQRNRIPARRGHPPRLCQRLRIGHNSGHRSAPPIDGWGSRSRDRANRLVGGQSISQRHVSARIVRPTMLGQSDRSQLSPQCQSHASACAQGEARSKAAHSGTTSPRPSGGCQPGISLSWTNAAGALAGATALEWVQLSELTRIVETSVPHSPFIYDDLAGTAEMAHSNQCTSA